MPNLEKIVERKGKKFLLRVEDSADHLDYQKYEDLRTEIWRWPGDALPSSRNMMCQCIFHDGGSLFIGAFAESEGGGFPGTDGKHLVGFAYGFVGVKDTQIAFRSLDNLHFYSLYTCVKKESGQYGLGVLIKEFQREQLIDLFGIYTINCTYDPLTGVNAYRNIHHFGMEVVEYNVDIYGEFGGNLNRVDVPSDRFTLSWELRKDVERPDYDFESLLSKDRIATRIEYSIVTGKSGPIEMEIFRGADLELDHEVLLVEIPFDFYRMLMETDVADTKVRQIPIEWRAGIRELFQSLFERNYRVIDFKQAKIDGRSRDFYVLKK
jgi:predicted GNAT superfamily acetyltransferase